MYGAEVPHSLFLFIFFTTTMISIITAVYNQLPMNRLYYECLRKFTSGRFELIIIDNGSNDGSAEFFERQGAKVIRTGANHSYPWCQNLGIRNASYDILAFLNNDLIVSPMWDIRALAVMERHGLEIGSCCATDRTESQESTRSSQRIWRYIRNPLLYLFGPSYSNLKLMFRLRYGKWEKWNRNRFEKYGYDIREGIAGSNIIMKRSALGKIGMWDERIQSADFDLVIRTKLRSIEYGDIKPVHLLLGVYMHHYIRLTQKRRHPAFVDGENIIDLDKKWDMDRVNPLLRASNMEIKSYRTA